MSLFAEILEAPTGYLMVCLCDVAPDEVETILYGISSFGAVLCDQHKNAVKLQSMAKMNCAIKFAHYDEKGDFYPLTLEECVERSHK